LHAFQAAKVPSKSFDRKFVLHFSSLDNENVKYGFQFIWHSFQAALVPCCSFDQKLRDCHLSVFRIRGHNIHLKALSLNCCTCDIVSGGVSRCLSVQYPANIHPPSREVGFAWGSWTSPLSRTSPVAAVLRLRLGNISYPMVCSGQETVRWMQSYVPRDLFGHVCQRKG